MFLYCCTQVATLQNHYRMFYFPFPAFSPVSVDRDTDFIQFRLFLYPFSEIKLWFSLGLLSIMLASRAYWDSGPLLYHHKFGFQTQQCHYECYTKISRGLVRADDFSSRLWDLISDLAPWNILASSLIVDVSHDHLSGHYKYWMG